MIGVRKQFDKQLFELVDKAARDIVKPLMKELYNLDCQDNPNKYGVDLLGYEDGKLINYIECEMSGVWKEGPFPYTHVRLPERKGKFCILDKPTLFVMINKTRTRAMIYSSDKVLRAELKEVSNAYIRSGEYFYCIPKEQTMEVDLIDRENT